VDEETLASELKQLRDDKALRDPKLNEQIGFGLRTVLKMPQDMTSADAAALLEKEILAIQSEMGVFKAEHREIAFRATVVAFNVDAEIKDENLTARRESLADLLDCSSRTLARREDAVIKVIAKKMMASHQTALMNARADMEAVVDPTQQELTAQDDAAAKDDAGSDPVAGGSKTSPPEHQKARGLKRPIGLAATISAATALILAMALLVSQRGTTVKVNPKIIVVLPSPSTRVAVPLKRDNSHGWGPSRQTFTDQVPADHPVFDSITNSGWVGDERQFLTCWDTGKSESFRDDELVADNGHTYDCMVIFSNDIADNLDNGTPATELVNSRAAVSLPETSEYNPGITAFLSAKNTETVWASCNFVSPYPMRVDYIPGSARMYTNGTPKNGLKLAETDNGDSITNSIVTSPGALLGYSRQDGIVRHSYQYSGYVIFKIKIALDPIVS
jgi:hypothetical protein